MSEQTTKAEELQAIGKNAYESIAEMVAALQCDYDRLAELRDERSGFEPACCCNAAEHGPDTCGGDCGCPECWDNWTPEQRTAKWAEANPEDAEELKELEEAAGDCEDADQARERIQEDALSVEVRSDWVTPGEPMTAGEYKILLTWGGPAVQIIGELDANGEPSRARLQAQDWFQPWTDYLDADQDTLLTYARCFYFGEQ